MIRRTRQPSAGHAALAAALLLCAAPAAADYLGSARSLVHEFGYCDGPPALQPLANVEVEVAGLGTAVTDAAGHWNLAGSGGPRQVDVVLRGPYCHVDENDEGPLASWTGVAAEGVPLAIVFDATNSRQDERNVFDAVNDARDFMADIDPGLPFLASQIHARVGVDLSCYVAWSDDSMEFSRENSGCANPGELEQAVHFVYGRLLHQAVQGGVNVQGLGAGNSDVLANLLTLDSKIGRGLLLGECDFFARDSDNDLVYPDDVIGQDEFTAGSVIAGFHWDVLVGLQQLYGANAGRELAAQLWHFARRLHDPQTQPQQVLAVFHVDDDDGDLGNGTPHYDVLCAAAEHHGFACPELDATAAAPEPGSAVALRLERNVPNPFNPSTRIAFSLPSAARARLAVFDVGGNRIATLIDETLAGGEHAVVWRGTGDDGARVSSGVYFYRLEAGGATAGGRMLLLK